MKEDGSILSKEPGFAYTEKTPAIDPKEFQKVIDSRRAVRVYDKTPVPEQIVMRCLRNALLAPNSSNLQPWELYWVRDTAKRKALVEACFDQVAARTAAELIVLVARTATWKRHAGEMADLFKTQKGESVKLAIKYYTKIVPTVYALGPLGILGFFKRFIFFFRGLSGPMLREPVGKSDLKTWAVKTTALAAENLMLSFRAYGFDTCPMEGYDSKRIRALLGLPRDAAVVMVVSAGKRAANGVYGPRIRYAEDRFIKQV